MKTFHRAGLFILSTALVGPGTVLIAPVGQAQSAEIVPPTPAETQPRPTPSTPGEPQPPGQAVPLNRPAAPPTGAGDAATFPTLVDQGNLFTDYLLGPGDQIQVLVIGYDEFMGPRVVLPDGTISMPLIGSVPAAGKTLDALSQDLATRLSYYLTNPVVDTNLSVLRPVVVNVVGEVYRPGPVQLSSLTQVNTAIRDNSTLTNFTNTPTLSTALTTAGGIRRTADIRNVTIQRRLADGSQAEFTVNLWEALNGRDELGVLVMFDGDTVVVPTAPVGETLDPRLIASSSIAPTNVRVRVIGEVVRPGEVEVQPNSSISSAIAAAGGPNTLSAQLNNVKLIRLTEAGQIQEEVVDLSNLVDNYQVQDGDVVFVEKRGYLTAVDNISRFLTPVLSPLNILNLLNLFD
ncbi:MAG: polysaccharide biosynthesis/export family protein [Nodosilinea sp.]